MASLATTPVKAPQPQSAAGDALTSPMSCVGPTPERPGQDVFGPRVLGTPNGAEVDGPLALPYGAFGKAPRATRHPLTAACPE